MIRNTPTWLRFYVFNKIAERYPQLLKDIKKEQKFEWLSHLFTRSRWYNASMAALLCFLLIGGLVYCTDICLEYGAFIDQRSSNLATISGMCLSVIVFLMSNIAVKETYAYELLFEKTKLYSVIFFVLTTLGIFILLSTLRNALWSELFRSAVIASGFMFLVVLGLIGYLFSTVIYYINSDQIDNFMIKRLSHRADKIFFAGLIKKNSKERFSAVLKQQGLIEYSNSEYFQKKIFEALIQHSTKKDNLSTAPKKKFIKDVNTIELANLAQQFSKPAYYDEISLDVETDQYDNYLISHELENSLSDKKKLKRILLLYKKAPKILLVSEVRQHFDERIPRHSEAGKSAELKKLIIGISTVYDSQLEYRTSAPHNITENFSGVLQQAFAHSVDKNTFDCFKLLYDFLFIKSYAALAGRYIEMFTDLLWLHGSIYQMGIQKIDIPAYNKILGYALGISDSYQEFFDELQKFKLVSKEDKQIRLSFSDVIFRSFSDTLFNMLHFRDVKGITRAMDMLERQYKVPEDYELRLEMSRFRNEGDGEQNVQQYKKNKNAYRESRYLQIQTRRMVYGVKAWVMHMLKNKEINTEMAGRLTSAMVIRNEHPLDPLEDLNFFRGREASLGYLGWLNKTFADRDEDSDERQYFNPGTWLTFGFMVEQITHNSLPAYVNDVNLDEFQSSLLIVGELQQTKEIFINNYEVWAKLLKVNSLQELIEKADAIINFFINLETKREDAELARIAQQPLDEELIKDQTTLAAATWKQQASIFELFRENGNLLPTGDSLPFIGHEQYVNGIRRFFLAEGNEHLNLLSTLANQYGRILDEEFFREALKDIDQPDEYVTVLDLIKAAIVQLDRFAPDIIFANSYDLHMDEGLRYDEKFQPSQRTEGGGELRIFGYYDSIPIYLTHEAFLKKNVIVANFKSAFSMEYKKDASFINSELKVIVRGVDKDEAELIFTKTQINTLNDEVKLKKKNRIRNNLHITLGVYAKFNVMEAKAVYIGALKRTRADNISIL